MDGFLHAATKTGNLWDDCRKVSVRLGNGNWFFMNFWRDPMQRGGHWSEEAGMGIVQDLGDQDVIAAVNDLLGQRPIDEIMEPDDNPPMAIHAE